MPPLIILKRNALHLYSIFRNYSAKKLAEEQSLMLDSDLYVKTFRRIIDCPDMSDRFINFFYNYIWYLFNRIYNETFKAKILEK